MGHRSEGWTLGQLAETLGGELCGNRDRLVRRPVAASTRDSEGIAFAESDEYVQQAITAGVGALLVGRTTTASGIDFVRVDNPRASFAMLLAMAARPLPLASGVHSTAVVDPSAQIDGTARIGAYAVVERGARIDEGARIFPFAYVGEDCVVGAQSVVYPHAVLYQDVRLGERTVVHAGAIVGADGFGYVWDGKRRLKVPQVGGVRIGDDVEIGALTAIDRATAGETEIGRGTKLDNFVQIAHNVKLGEDCAIASQTGIAGSSIIGNRVVMAGQVGIGDHASVCDDAAFAGRSTVVDPIEAPGGYFGSPARPLAEGARSYIVASKLPELFARLRRLERAITKRGDD